MAKSHPFERSEVRLRRGNPKKRIYDRLLIVCEGAKTEVNYFEAIRRELRIPSVDFHVIHSALGTAPLQVIESAEKYFAKSKAFDYVFVVFDRDSHQTYHDALSKAQSLDGKLKNDENKKVSFRAIPSVPSFEFWLLLHFKNVLAPMNRAQVHSELRKPAYYPTYQKNISTVYEDTKGNMHTATERAEYLRGLYNPYSGIHPYTDVDILTGKMFEFKNRLS
jgi:hypothetical protein